MEPGSVPQFGAIFMSSFRTRQECFDRRLFGLPPSFIEFVKGTKKGMLSFLFEYENRKLYGVFEATSDGAVDIIPDAYRSSGKFPAQVKFRLFWRCGPLSEYEFCYAIKENYYAAYRFRFGLSKIQVLRLLELFATNKIRPKGLPKFKKNLTTPLDKGKPVINFERYCPDKDDSLDVECETEISLGGPESGEILSLRSVVVPSPKEKEKKDISSTCVDFLGNEDFIPLMCSPQSPEHESSDQRLDIPSVDHLGVKALYSDIFDSQVDVFTRLKMEEEGGAVDTQRTRVQRKGTEFKVAKRKRRHDNPENGD